MTHLEKLLKTTPIPPQKDLTIIKLSSNQWRYGKSLNFNNVRFFNILNFMSRKNIRLYLLFDYLKSFYFAYVY